MSVLRMVTAGACLLLGTTVVLTQDQLPPQKGDTSGTKDQVKAFPSAEGFGAETRGAYGKAGVTPKVYRVTTLEDPATRAAKFDGSFRWAIEAPEPRVIVFAVSGYIVIKKPLVIENPYVTIAGQTAPGDGICLRNDPAHGKTTLLIATHDVIVRHLRARPGRANSGVKVSSQQAIQVGQTGARAYNVILDHCSATWGIDGCMQTGSTTHDVTFQWCIISEGLNQAGHDKGAHSRGLAFYVGARGNDDDLAINGRFSVHHNLMSHVQYRAPHIATKYGMVEVINNVVYHTTQIGMNINTIAHGVGGASKNRFVKNYLLRTADTRGDISFRDHVPGVLVHAHGNIGPSRADDSLADNLSLGTAHMTNCPICNSTKPPSQRNHWTKDPLCTDAKGGAFPYPKIRVTEDDNAKVTLARISGTGAFSKQLNVGATKPTRDAVDARIVRQLTDYLANPKDLKTVPVPGGPRGGLLDDPAQAGGYPKLAGGTPPVDTDGDGIPDAWERAHGLNPNQAADAHQIAANGYTNIENYLNELAGDFTQGMALFDGKTLDGWMVCGGKATYKVEDGVIVGTTVEGSPNTFLCTKKEYGDFELTFEVKCDPKLNSGVQVRSHAYAKDTPQPSNPKRIRPAGDVYGCQVEISADGNAGRIWDEARHAKWHDPEPNEKARTAYKPDEWNRYRIVAQGDQIRTWINDVPVADIRVQEKEDATGFIGLQVHSIKPGTGPYQVRWRNLQIRELKPDEKID